MYQTIRIHAPAVAQMCDVVEISTLSTIPEFLRDAVTISQHKLWLDNVEGCKSAPLGTVIAYEKCDQTVSGYNCWPIGRIGIDLIKDGDAFYTKPHIIHAMLIPDKDEPKPVWVNSCNLTYNGDGTATLKTDEGSISGRIGIDFLLCHGRQSPMRNGKPKASILATYDEAYNSYIVCDDFGKDLGNLSELYPA